MIPYNKPYFSEACIYNIRDTIEYNKQSGDGSFTKLSQDLLCSSYGFEGVLFTPSCTHALEMMALLLEIKPGDEIIVPSYTFVTTANAFEKYGAKVVCVDSTAEHPNIDPQQIKNHLTDRTVAVVVVHYGGWGCDMDTIVEICQAAGIILLEDAAQAIHSFYKEKPLGSFGAMSAFSFHETKNINCGEGGMLVINDPSYLQRAQIIREKGTNRTAFAEGKINKYEWVDIGSSYLLAEINIAYLYPQLLDIEAIIGHRKTLWNTYYTALVFKLSANVQLPVIPTNCRGNYHIFYLLLPAEVLGNLQRYLKEKGIMTTTHYVPLHLSSYYQNKYPVISLPNAEQFGNSILRFPLYNSLTVDEVKRIVTGIIAFFDGGSERR